jgi:hypothetical protein
MLAVTDTVADEDLVIDAVTEREAEKLTVMAILMMLAQIWVTQQQTASLMTSQLVS